MSSDVKSLASPYAFSSDDLMVLSAVIRLRVFQICQRARSGHIGGSSGAVELFMTLYFGGVLRYSPRWPTHSLRDRVLVRGHLGPVRYPLFQLLGWVDEEELWTYRQYGSRLHGHEDHTKLPGVDLTPSGSLGMLLSYGAGVAFAAKQRGEEYQTYVFLGDGEEEEGNVSEAARHAAHLRLENLTVIIDCNGKQLSDPLTETDSASLAEIWYGYGWEVVELAEGHDPTKILDAYQKAREMRECTKKPIVIIAHTVKGYGLDGTEEHFSGYHTISTCPPTIVQKGIERLERWLEERKEFLQALKERVRHTQDLSTNIALETFMSIGLTFAPKEKTPNHPDFCQEDYFAQLREAHGTSEWPAGRTYFLTADVTRYDQVQQLRLREFCVYVNMGIREQHTIGFAHGISCSDPTARIVINSFDAFTYRWFDQINAAVQGGSHFTIIADTAGLTNAQNGRTHQSTGQPGAVLAMPGISFLEPWDAEDTFRCFNWAVGESRGIVYLRIHSSVVQVSPMPGVKRTLTSYVAWESTQVELTITIVASGFPVSSAIQAGQQLEREGIGVRVVNLVDHKRSDEVLRQLLLPGKLLLTVYNGNTDVLLQNVARIICTGDLTRAPCRVAGMGFEEGATGTFDQLRRVYALDADGVVARVRNLLS